MLSSFLNRLKIREKNVKITKYIAIFLFSLLWITTIQGCQRKILPKRNILFITIDALRADHLSCYCYKRQTSPNIDTLASQGILFARAIVQASYTSASMASIFTSKYPHQHQVLHPWNTHLKESFITLAEILKKHHYSTAAITPNFVLVPQFGFRRSFDFCSMVAPEDKQTDVALDWIRQHIDDSFFVWIHYMSPHTPCAPPPPYDRIYINDDFSSQESESLKVVDDISGLGGIPRHAAIDNITDKNIYISLYDGEISFADYQVGRLLEEIEELGILDNAFIILTADHGEDLGEHGYHFTHGFTLYDSLIRVPLIMKLNKIIPEGKVINSQVQSIDITPTILDLLNIDKHLGMEGISILPLISGREGRLNKYVFSDIVSKQSIRTDDWKLIYNKDNNSYELYNLKNDPGELYNLAHAEKEKFLSLKEELTDYIEQAKWPKSWKVELGVPMLKPVKPEVPHESLDEGLKERLRSLGYIQ